MEWLEDFKRRYDANSETAEMNRQQDSGWSKQIADRCEDTERQLLRELLNRLADSPTTASDFFDRPWLVEIQEAARFVSGKT